MEYQLRLSRLLGPPCPIPQRPTPALRASAHVVYAWEGGREKALRSLIRLDFACKTLRNSCLELPNSSWMQWLCAGGGCEGQLANAPDESDCPAASSTNIRSKRLIFLAISRDRGGLRLLSRNRRANNRRASWIGLQLRLAGTDSGRVLGPSCDTDALIFEDCRVRRRKDSIFLKGSVLFVRVACGDSVLHITF